MSWIQSCVKKVVEEKLLVSDASTSASSDSAVLQSSKYKSENHAKTHAFIVSSTDMKRNAAALSEAFPPSLHTRVLHAFAVKANGLKGVLEVVNEGTQGCEAASIGELLMAQKVVDNTRIVYDSPVKTIEELQYCCYSTDKAGNGIYLINVDNFAELERIAQLHKKLPIKTHIGIRVNPQVGAGSISHLSTGVATSKFGIGILDYREQIINAFVTHKDFLCGLHVHTGSQGIPLALMAKGVKTIMDLADEINAKLRHTNGSCSDNEPREVTGGVSIIDIGGGLPVNFDSDEIFPTFQDYSAKLRDELPSLFSGKYALVTEFGRAMVAKAGILVSRIEYVKENGGRRIIQQHVGADLAVRTVWQPEHWPLRIDIVDGHNGEVKTKNIAPTDVAGPCCFAKDLLCCNCPLPAATPLKDLVVVKDVGAYYHSAFSFYNLRAMPPCYLYNEDTHKLHLINPGTSIEETIKVFE